MTTVISVENLSKVYRLGQIGTGTFSKDLKVWWAKLHGKPNPLLKIGQTVHGNRDGEEIWALKDISFTVEQGEVLGIIGRNGAGKSTLLKIVSRITAPTSGRVKLKGRVASLLEVGTGFHPELTGRENIYLNGAILGMSRAEIDRKFDEIVDFAEVVKFIDTPVKRYSSGMYVRLAFAVAAHLEPEILLIDEVLAVGDAGFRKKCLGKMGDVAREGRTVLFISHNMGAVGSLCQRALLLEKGQIILNRTAKEVIRSYLGMLMAKSSYWAVEKEHLNNDINFSEIYIKNKDGELTEFVNYADPMAINILTMNMKDAPNAEIHIRLVNEEGTPVFTTSSSDEKAFGSIRKGNFLYEVMIPGKLLKVGRYTLVVAAMIPGQKMIDIVDSVITFSIIDDGTQKMSRYDRLGVVNPMINWIAHEYNQPHAI